MKMASVQAQQLTMPDGVAEIELMRANHKTLRADAKQLALHGVEVMAGIKRLGEDLIQRAAQQLAGRAAVDRQVLKAVGNPDVRDARRAQLASESLANLAASNPMPDPEAADGFIPAGEREAAGRLRMREERAVEIEAHLATVGPVDPGGKMFRDQFIALDRSSARLRIDRVQVQPVAAGNQTQCLVQVCPQLLGIAGFAGIIACGLDAAIAESAGALEAAHVVALPAVERKRDATQGGQRGFGINAQRGIAL